VWGEDAATVAASRRDATIKLDIFCKDFLMMLSNAAKIKNRAREKGFKKYN
jgi:hypothetical protein